MGMKMSSFITIVICVLVIAMAVTPKVEAQLGFFNGILSLVHIQGTIFCTANGQIGVNGTSTPVFSDAVVQLQCGNGTSATVVSSTTTNSSGIFTMNLNPLTLILTILLRDCNLIVTTPLSTCNATLPSIGRLVSTLQSNGTNNIVPRGFRFSTTNLVG